ncbi:hypothetical protein [Gluconobacter japonicus]|uniref:hypothetical protein n=1 Tax=Gluconobacter japonicus TaxID=376620 RepID=UPI0039EA11C4
MKRLIESDIYIDVPDQVSVTKFDDASHHFLINQMQAVDFIIETNSHFLFVEIKDPDHPDADNTRKENFIRKLKSGEIDKSLYTKYRDTWLYRHMNSEPFKPIKYLVLIACASLSSAELMARQDALQKKIPVMKDKGERWSKFIDSCTVLNLTSWNAALSQLSAGRLSSVAPP